MPSAEAPERGSSGVHARHTPRDHEGVFDDGFWVCRRLHAQFNRLTWSEPCVAFQFHAIDVLCDDPCVPVKPDSLMSQTCSHRRLHLSNFISRVRPVTLATLTA